MGLELPYTPQAQALSPKTGGWHKAHDISRQAPFSYPLSPLSFPPLSGEKQNVVLTKDYFCHTKQGLRFPAYTMCYAMPTNGTCHIGQSTRYIPPCAWYIPPCVPPQFTMPATEAPLLESDARGLPPNQLACVLPLCHAQLLAAEHSSTSLDNQHAT